MRGYHSTFAVAVVWIHFTVASSLEPLGKENAVTLTADLNVVDDRRRWVGDEPEPGPVLRGVVAVTAIVTFAIWKKFPMK